MQKIKIGNKIIEKNSPCFIIAEAGINHNGDIKLAKRLIDVAVEAGVDAIKFQTFKAEEEVTKEAPKAEYQKENSDKNESYYEMIRKLEFNEENHKVLMNYCRKKQIIFLSTPSEEKSAELLNKLGVDAFKIGSNDIVTLPMLEQIAAYNKPIILSRGMATEEEIKNALDVIKGKGNNDIVVLHCTSSYPSKIRDLNLNIMNTIKDRFNVLVGYSDHSEGLDASIIAVILGTSIVEKHITLDKKLPGPDQKFAIDPNELKKMVNEIRNVEKMSKAERQEKLHSISNYKEILGKHEIKPTESELKMRKYMRKSIVAKHNMKAGEDIKIKDIAFKRPGVGIPVQYYKKIIGKKLKFPINKDQFINFEMLE